jgi:hypothetical protein
MTNLFIATLKGLKLLDFSKKMSKRERYPKRGKKEGTEKEGITENNCTNFTISTI